MYYVQGADPVSISIGVDVLADCVAELVLPLWERAAHVVIEDWVPGVWTVSDNNKWCVKLKSILPFCSVVRSARAM